MTDLSDLTPRQRDAYAALYSAIEAHRIAAHGRKEYYRERMEEARIETLRADSAARREREQRRVAA